MLGAFDVGIDGRAVDDTSAWARQVRARRPRRRRPAKRARTREDLAPVPDLGERHRPGSPKAAAASTGPGLRDATFTSWPASTRWRAIGSPIAPRPMNPSCTRRPPSRSECRGYPRPRRDRATPSRPRRTRRGWRCSRRSARSPWPRRAAGHEAGAARCRVGRRRSRGHRRDLERAEQPSGDPWERQGGRTNIRLISQVSAPSGRSPPPAMTASPWHPTR